MFKGSGKKPASLTDELQYYCHEFNEFNQRCERICKALAEIANQHESISSYSVRGMRHNATWLKYRINEFSRQLQALHERAHREER
ncbi:MAG: hypothetical protein B6D72_05065 [gamma proteobacterium symbiont of Ctena orbiculata]|uniref:Uncharacterized protein n=1 Tax=Candidatus Thiodiazotropha taylori TaxID=2792791 RepID=A0A944MC40_9GAMM|nr:hypothetical protein [Candidatus Thiodiazotropha taylori]PUB88704.1 MAG: hypothetical protein DBP00_04785 [gamma proteobacterium symbiont of Ctena orbiculata]MBT2991183.1 hypothetical protein [Candidatus Thiodiazotropha taylori]MBT2998808.1 hypothetical protein [Candidatus Thiodiazotropha taylori]MBT3002316.1 hypothetical protein [Candidatus Thiodiazotropha taylori]